MEVCGPGTVCRGRGPYLTRKLKQRNNWSDSSRRDAPAVPGAGEGLLGAPVASHLQVRSPGSFPDDSRFLETHQGTLTSRFSSLPAPTSDLWTETPLNSGIPRPSTSFVQNPLGVPTEPKPPALLTWKERSTGSALKEFQVRRKKSKGRRGKGTVETGSQRSGDPGLGKATLFSPVSGAPTALTQRPVTRRRDAGPFPAPSI